MANVLLNAEKKIEAGAEHVLHFLTGAENALKASPQVVAALGTVFGQVATATSDFTKAATAGGLSIVLDEQVYIDLKPVWPDVRAFLLTLGIEI